MNNLGYIKLYRKILDNPIVNKDNDHLIIFLWLLLNATHKKREILFSGKIVILKPGQLVVGRKKLSCESRVTESKTYRVLKCFESEHLIEQQKSNKNTLITILNWNKYQFDEQQNEQQLNNNRTTTEQQLNTNNNDNNVINIYYYNYLEKIYDRPISSPEVQLLDYLLEKYDKDLVMEALKNSCINNVKKLSYVKRTLKNWELEGKTLKDFQENSEEKKKDDQLVNLDEIGNWLEED